MRIDALPPRPTGIEGLVRQDVYDSAHSDDDRRLVQWRVRPETEVPAWNASDWVELWVRGGEIEVNARRAHANCFVIVEPDATVRIASGYGAIALVWAEGRERWLDGATSASLFGY